MPAAKKPTVHKTSTKKSNGSMPKTQKAIYDKLIRKGLSEKRALSFSKNAARRVEVSERRHKAAVASAKKGPAVSKPKRTSVKRRGKR